ncbi:MAG: ribosome silencing factor [Actinobacteria bacterium]|nr:ribosome silencing factor [Actinomycetota bacterium]
MSLLLKSIELAKLAVEAAIEKKAENIVVLDIGKILTITDYFVIMSGRNERQVKSISDAIQEKLKKEGIKPLSVEGEREARWILLDYLDVVVHVFVEQEREYYQLERLWKDAPLIEFSVESLQDAGLK